jgi:nicotinamidase-related amidase
MSGIAVVVIDVLNPYDHEDADELAGHVEPTIEPLRGLIKTARDAEDIELIYVNDNYGNFAASRDDMVEAALKGKRPDLIEPIVPPDDVEFLQKVRHSAFYSTALYYLLERRKIETLVLAGQVTEQCILYSALDAYVRHFDIRVPRDAVAPIDRELGDAALQMMERNMQVDVVTAADAVS